MSSINRYTLPQNFLDSVSSGLRLVQPEPQYLFAKAALGARLSLAAIDAGAITVQQYVTMAAGGAPVPPTLDEMARAADMFAGAVVAVDEFGANAGDTIKLRRPIFEGGGYSEAARMTSPDKATSTVGQSLKAEETLVVLQEFEGPYSVSGNQVQPYAIREFDARFRANRDQLTSLTTMHLRRDYVKWLDIVIRDRFRATSNVTLPNGVANAASFASGGTAIISLDQIANARKAISDREWSPFPNGRYMCLVPTKFNVDMISDPDWKDLSKFHPDKNILFGYLGSYQDVDFFECTTLKTFAAGDVVDGATVGAGVTLQEALLIGPGAVGMGTAMAPTAHFADDTDYGKYAKVIWRSVQAFQTLDSRAVQRILFQ